MFMDRESKTWHCPEFNSHYCIFKVAYQRDNFKNPASISVQQGYKYKPLKLLKIRQKSIIHVNEFTYYLYMLHEGEKKNEKII